MNTPFQKAQAICHTLQAANHTALLAGGCVRDSLLGVSPKDYDIATTATPDEVAALFPKCIPVGAAFGVMMVLDGDDQFELATFRTDGDYSDGRRPDSSSSPPQNKMPCVAILQ